MDGAVSFQAKTGSSKSRTCCTAAKLKNPRDEYGCVQMSQSSLGQFSSLLRNADQWISVKRVVKERSQNLLFSSKIKLFANLKHYRELSNKFKKAQSVIRDLKYCNSYQKNNS